MEERYLIGSHVSAYPYENTKLYIYNRDNGRTFVLGEKEAQVFRMMNGVNTVEDIHNGCPFYSAGEIKKLAEAFSEIGLFRRTKKKWKPFKIKLPICNPNRLLKEDSAVTSALYYAICAGAPMLFTASFFAMRFLHRDLPAYLASSLAAFPSMSLENVAVIVTLALLSLALHEFGHMAAARHFGVHVPEIGVMLYFLIPCAYTDITGISLLRDKRKRLIVLFAGSLVNVGLIGVCFLVMALGSSTVTGMYCLAFILVNLGTIFMNMMILLKFDGYYVLETILDEPGLRENAMGHAAGLIRAAFGGKREEKKMFREVGNGSALRHMTYCVYAALSAAYVPFVMASTVIPYFF